MIIKNLHQWIDIRISSSMIHPITSMVHHSETSGALHLSFTSSVLVLDAQLLFSTEVINFLSCGLVKFSSIGCLSTLQHRLLIIKLILIIV